MKLHGSLNNYISMHRKRLGLSQAELAVLINIENRASVANYERGARLPELPTLLALEIVSGHPIQAIFAGIAEDVRQEVALRARALLEAMSDTPTQENLLKLETLSRVAHPDDIHVIPLWEETA